MADKIIEKGNSGLFENEIEAQGKYGNYMRFFRDDINLFTSFREAYVTAAILGFMNNLTTMDETASAEKASIFPNEINKRKADLKFLYRMIMMLREENGFTIDDYMNRAFRDDSDEDDRSKLRANMMIFNSYACGGLDYLYDKFGALDRKEDIIEAVYELVHNLSIDVGLAEDDESELPDWTPDF